MIAHPLILDAALAVLAVLQAWARWPGVRERERRRCGPLRAEVAELVEWYYVERSRGVL